MPTGLMQRVGPPLLFQHYSQLSQLLGAWLMHIVLIIGGKIIIDTLPGMTQQISWTLVNLIYLAVRAPYPTCFTIVHTPTVVISHVPLGHRYTLRRWNTRRRL